MPRSWFVWLLMPVLVLSLTSCARSPKSATAEGDARPAPEMNGEDADGVPLKLSDYRGKVVLLDFWATW